MTIADGFPGQRIRVLARPLVHMLQQQPTARRLLVTDCGYFPRAVGHGRARPEGIDQAIVMLCTEGSGTVDLPTGRHDVRSGQAVVVPPGVAHSYAAHDADPWTLWWMHVVGDDVADLLTTARTDADRPVITPSNAAQVVGLFDEVVTRMSHDEAPATVLATSGAAWHLLTLLVAQSSRPDARIDPVAQATEILRTRAGQRVPVSELARMVGLSASHLSALFRRTMGSGILEYQTMQRMALARTLLDTTDHPVARVAAEAGYSDSFYFSRQFRQVHGVSPSAYRAAPKG